MVTAIETRQIKGAKTNGNDEQHNRNHVNMIAQDAPQFVLLLKDMAGKLREVKEQLKPMAERVASKEIETTKGISLLDVKYHLMLQYLSHLAFYTHLKLDGHPVSGHSTVTTLVELRIVLEKLRPLEQKLKYQMDKLIRAATVFRLEKEEGRQVGGKANKGPMTASSTGAAIAHDPLRFKPNPAGLAERVDDTEEDERAGGGLYRPPKMAPVAFDENPHGSSKQARDQSRLMARAAKSRMMRDLMTEMDDQPEEMDALGGVSEGMGFGEKVDGAMKEREQYEEENFTRLMLSRRDKKRLTNTAGRGRFENEFENLEDFGNLVGMEDVDKQQEEELKSVLGRRKMKNLRKQDGDGDEDEYDDAGGRPSKRGRGTTGSSTEGLFNGLISNPGSLGSKGKSPFAKAKKIFKSRQRGGKKK